MLSEAIEQLRRSGLTTPVLLRFPDILKSRVDALFNAFGQAIEKSGYEGDYLCVYPIKVNQQRRVIETISQSYSDKPRLGLEAGSKPELLAVLSHHHEQGLRDRLQRLQGPRIHPPRPPGQPDGPQGLHRGGEALRAGNGARRVCSSQHQAQHRGAPRLASTGSGMWESSGGSMSKFGLSASQILALVERLRSLGKLDCLQLLHFHLGSQIANIRDIQGGIRECGRFYAELCRLGAKVEVVDVGGGLGVDYEGTRSQSHCSANYSLSSTPTTWSGASAMSAASSTCRTRPSSASPAVP